MSARVERRPPRRRAAKVVVVVASLLAYGAGSPSTVRAQGGAAGEQASADPLLIALREEVQRSLDLRLPGAPPPRLVLARVVDEARVEVGASLGALLEQDEDRTRTLTVEVKVGDLELDSGNVLVEGEPPVRSARVAYEDGTPELRRTLWLLADGSYKAASSVLEARRSKGVTGGRPPAWSDEGPSRGPPSAMPDGPDPVPLARMARELSGVFRGVPEVEEARAHIIASSRRRTMVGSDGTEVMDAGRVFMVTIGILARTAGGEPVLDHRSFATHDPPELGVLLAEVQKMGPEIRALRTAPTLGDWVGPVLFAGRAAPQLIEAVFAPHLSGTPRPESLSGATFEENPLARRLGRRILPRGVRLRDDPTAKTAHGLALIGALRWDDEGTPAQAVTLAEDGRLERLLTGRVPPSAGTLSNGHGRASTGAPARGRPANLLLESRAGSTLTELRARALARAREEGVDHALQIDLLDDPAITLQLLPHDDRPMPDVPRPLIARRLSPDGASELVRLGRLEGLGVRDLARVLAVGADYAVHSFLAPGGLVALRRNQHGDLPTSIVSPSLLIGDIELRAMSDEPGRIPLSSPPARATPAR